MQLVPSSSQLRTLSSAVSRWLGLPCPGCSGPEEPRGLDDDRRSKCPWPGHPLDTGFHCSETRSDAAPSCNRSQGEGEHPSDDRGDPGGSPLRKREPALRRAQPQCGKTESREEKDKDDNLQECLRVRSDGLRGSVASSTVSSSADDHSAERSSSTRLVIGASGLPGRNRQLPATGCDDPPPLPTCVIRQPWNARDDWNCAIGEILRCGWRRSTGRSPFCWRFPSLWRSQA
jgi:hypothetical protein